MFCSIAALTEIFGKDLTFGEMKEILQDVKVIRKLYRKERGFIKSLSVKEVEILDAFCLYGFYTSSDENLFLGDWRIFVKDAKVGGADFIDLYI